MAKKAVIVLGLGYGDEGKGLVTDYYCLHEEKSLVIRHNGGQQAGHTVFSKAGKRHVFSNFGAGTLRGIPTYWSKYCTFSPGFTIDEAKILARKTTPKLFVDLECAVTTHYDILYNRAVETTRGKLRHGSCGLGVGATFERHKKLHTKLMVQHLLDKNACIKRLEKIRAYYREKVQSETSYRFDAFDHDSEDKLFLDDLQILQTMRDKGILVFVNEKDLINKQMPWDTLIFEGAQGILLDVACGQHPHITKSNTTSKNALALIKRSFDKNDIKIEIAYVTRAYLTRHGAGPFVEAIPSLKLKNNSFETNRKNEFQGDFKIGYLNINLLKNSIMADRIYSKNLPANLFITCVDQLATQEIKVYSNGNQTDISVTELPEQINCNFKSVKYSKSPFAEDL